MTKHQHVLSLRFTYEKSAIEPSPQSNIESYILELEGASQSYSGIFVSMYPITPAKVALRLTGAILQAPLIFWKVEASSLA